MLRPRLYDFRHSDGPKAIGICEEDIERCARAVNAAQQRLLYAPEQSDEGFPGTWAEIAFSVDRDDPYITTPRGIARLEAVDVGSRPVQMSNQFAEYMMFGNGRMPKCERWNRRDNWGITQGYTRNNACCFTDLKDGPQQIQIYASNPLDFQANPITGKVPRVFVQGTCRGQPIVTQDNGFTVQGEFITLASPFATSVHDYDSLSGIQKDITLGDVQIFQSDPYWGSLEILSVMEPTETTAWYRRYYLHNLPRHCSPFTRSLNRPSTNPCCTCHPRSFVLVTALAKMDLIPVTADPDYLTIPNVEALILECQAIRMSRMDDPDSRKQSEIYHKQAVRLLIGQLNHEQGKNNISVNFRPFGSASLDRVHIGMT